MKDVILLPSFDWLLPLYIQRNGSSQNCNHGAFNDVHFPEAR